MKVVSCPYCGCEKEKLVAVPVTIPAAGYAIACIFCKAQGPVKSSIDDALSAFRTRSERVIVELEENAFVVAFGYEKFMLNYEQMIKWRDVDERTLIDRVGEKRRLLTDWELLPPSKWTSVQRSL